MPIYIPDRFDYRDNQYNIGAEDITLDDTSPEGQGIEEAKEHPLFIAMLKYLIAPVAEKPYQTFEDNLRHYLNTDFLSRVADQNPEMEFNATAYDSHIKWASERLFDLTMGEFLDICLEGKYLGSKSEKTFNQIKAGMEDEGLQTPLRNLMDNVGRVGSSGQDKIMSYQTKGEVASRLWRAANEKDTRKQYNDILTTLEEHPEFITINQSLKKGITHVEIKVDFISAFEEVIQEQGVRPLKERITGAFAKSKKPTKWYNWRPDPDKPKPTKEQAAKFFGTPKKTPKKESTKVTDEPYEPPNYNKLGAGEKELVAFINEIYKYNQWVTKLSEYEEMDYSDFEDSLKEVINKLSKRREIRAGIFRLNTGEEFDPIDLVSSDLQYLKYPQKLIDFVSQNTKDRPDKLTEIETEIASQRQQKTVSRVMRQAKKRTKKSRKIVHAHDLSPYNDRQLFTLDEDNKVISIDLKNGKSFHSMLREEIIRALNPIYVGILTIKVSGQTHLGDNKKGFTPISDTLLEQEKELGDNESIPIGAREKHQRNVEENWRVFYLDDASYKPKWKYNYRAYTQPRDLRGKQYFREKAKKPEDRKRYELQEYMTPRTWDARTEEGGHAQGVRTKQIHTLQYIKKQLTKLNGMISDA